MIAATAAMLENDEDLIVPDVPLAQVEDGDIDDIAQQSTIESVSEQNAPLKQQKIKNLNENKINEINNINDLQCHNFDKINNFELNDANLSVSLENLVETFDQKITTVLKNLDKNTNQMAPVQVRTQDEVMSESQVWWTLTGNYGNIMPLDFSKSQIRKNQLDALCLHSPKSCDNTGRSFDAGCECDDEDDLREALDFHHLISEHVHVEGEIPPISAEQVIEEIDEMMQACDMIRSTSATTEHNIIDGCSIDSMYSSMKSPFTTTMSSQTTDSDFKSKHNAALSLTSEELNVLSQSKLLSIANEMEEMIQAYNMNLVNELAHRDEFEYEKEVKNKFITLLVNIQEQRRKAITESKRKNNNNATKFANTLGAQLTTASIPFDETQSTLNINTLESLIKILQAISDDNPNLPNLLTEYILTVVCPSTTSSMII